MKRLIIFSFLLYFGCTPKQNNNETVVEEKIMTDTIKKIVNIQEQKNNTPDVNTLETPVGLKIETGYASSADIYSFYDDSVIVLIFDDIVNNWWIGKWHMHEDTIVMNFHKSVHERGIGEPIHSDGVISAGGPNVEYSEYATDIHLINRTLEESWKNIKSGIEENIHKILDWNIKNRPEKYDIKLNGEYSFASSKRLKKEDLNSFSKKELRIIRNEIFARYGFKFKSTDLQDYFKKTGWYEPTRDNVDLFLSDLEKENIKLIQELEIN